MSTGEPIIASSHKGDATQLSFDQAQTTKRVNTASGNTRLDDTESTIDEVIRHRPYGFPQFLTDLAATTTTPISQSLHERTSNFGPGLLGLSPASISLGISSVTTHAATNVPATSTGTSATKRLYRAGENKWVTRDIASLDFLLGIPLAAEQDIVTTGWRLQLQREDEDDTSSHSSSNRNRSELNTDYDKGIPSTAKGTWWEKWVQPENMKLDSAIHRTTKKNKINESEAAELEQPTEADTGATFAQMSTNMNPAAIGLSYAPGRRLEGDEAVRIHIPLTFDNTITKQRSIARQANLRQWELQTAHGLAKCGAAPPMLDGRLFFSANSGYPISVFSVIRYEPSK